MIGADFSNWLQTAVRGIWTRIPLFWRFQLCGWIGHFIYAYPLKWVTQGDLSDSFVVALYRDSLGFALTLLMREGYRRIYGHLRLFPDVALIATGTSLVGGALITGFVLGSHNVNGISFVSSNLATTVISP